MDEIYGVENTIIFFPIDTASSYFLMNGAPVSHYRREGGGGGFLWQRCYVASNLDALKISNQILKCYITFTTCRASSSDAAPVP